MMRSLYSAVSGLQSHQVRMDVVGNNIANVNTIGYKRSRVTFQDVLSQTLKEAQGPSANIGGINPAQVGTGVMLGAVDMIFTQGAISSTGGPTDVMIQGKGFFMLGRGNETYYTRAGAFTFDENGDLVNSSNGMYVLDDSGNGPINIPNIDQVRSYSITSNGEVVYVDSNGTTQVAGNIGLAMFANPGGLKKVGENLFEETTNSGPVAMDLPGLNGRGTLISGALEMSNVDLATEFTDMIITQRGFQANSRTIRTSDQMLEELVNLKR